MKNDIKHEEYDRIPKALKLQPGDRIVCHGHEDMVSTMRDLAYEGYVFRQVRPFVIVIDRAPEEEE